MKLVIIACLAAFAAADVSHILNKKDEESAKIEAQEYDAAPEGSYRYAFKTENGISAVAQGDITLPAVRNGEQPVAVQRVQGEVSWTSPEGLPISFSYLADENGFQPQGAHLPTSPPIPDAILRSLEYIQAHPPAPEK